MKLSCALVLTLTNFVIATPFSFSAKGSGASAKAGAVTAPFGTFGVVQPVASNAGYTGSFSKFSSLSSASGGTALSPGSFSYNSAQDNRAPWPGYGTSFTTQAQAVGQNVLTFPQVNKNSITSFSDTSVVATTGANGQTEITGSYPSENSNDLNANNSGASRLQYQRPSETQEKIPSSTLSSLTSETHESSKPNTPDFPSILKVPGQSDNFKETSKVQNVSSQIVTSGSAYLTSFPNAAVGNIVPQTTVASSENYQIGEQKPNYNGGFGGPPGILKPFDKGSNFKNSDSVNAFLTHKPNVQLSSPVTTKPQGFNNSPENTIKLSYVYTNKGSTDTIKPTDQPLSSGSSNFNAGTSYKPERNPTQTSQIKPTLANNLGKPSSVLKPNEDQLYTLQHFDEITQTSDGTLTQSFEGSSKPQFSSQIPSKFNKPTIDAFSQSKLINGVQVSGQAYPSNDPNSSSDYNVNYENTNIGNESSEKLLNKPTKQSLYASGFGAPTAVVEPVKSEVNNTSKPYLGFTVTSQKETTNTGGSSNILSASQQPSVVSTNYYTTPTPYISSISTTDKSDYVTTTVQSETNQPSNNSSQSSSFNLTYQKNPSLFNVASSGVQSSTLSSNSYPVKPQSQYPEKQVSELGSQKKPFFSNSFGTFVTPKPTSYSGSTAYTSFSSLGYGHSGVSGSLDKSKPTSQFTFTNQYKPSFTNSFGGQSGVLKPSNQLTQTSSTFISSNQPTNYKPVVTPSPLNTAKANEEISVTNEKNSSIVNDYETVSSLSQQSSDTASTQPSIVSTNYYTSPAPSISSESPIFGSNVEQHKYDSGSAISNTSETDKKNNVTNTVQKETNQPSNNPSHSSSFNLTYQKNPSLFNVASSGVQSSTLSSNSYPVKPQSQYPEKQVFEFGLQKKPSFSNSFGTFVTPKPTSYPSSTAYTSFSSLGYGNSGVSGSLDKSKPTSQFTSTIRYKPSFTNSFGGQSEVLKPSNQLTQTSSTFVSSNQPTNYKPFVTPSPLNTAKPNKQILVTDQKNSSIVNDYETVSSLSQQSSDTASKQPSIISTNYYTSPAPSISSELPSSDSNVEEHKDALGSAISNTSVTDKKNNVTATVQTETNQPSNKPSQSSSFNLTYQKNPSLFNVAPSGVQSSIYSSNSYPIKPQSQFPEQQAFEFGSQKKPSFSNSFGTFVTPKPTSYPSSTAYTSFSSLGYGNSGVSGSLDKSKPTSQFTSTIRYKPSFTNSFGGQSEVLKPSNQLTQTSSTFVSSNQPTNYKPFVTPSPLNTAKPNKEISVTDQKNSSIVNDYETVSSLSQQSSDTASKQPSIISTNYYTSPAPSISSELPSSDSNVEEHKDALGSAISNTSETDKKNNVTATVQTETNQPSNKPSQSSSFNLTYQKNPSLFNVAPSGVQSSIYSSNSYPIKPQSQFPEQQVFEFGSQKKPSFSNSFGTFVTPKPTSYTGSTAYTSFSSLGYGNSGVFGSLDKSKPTSQFISTIRYKPSFTNSFGGQSEVLKPSNQLTQTSSTFVSSNQPTNYKPFVSPSPLNTAKPNEEISVAGQKNYSTGNVNGTGPSLSQQSSYTASQQPSVVSTNYNTTPAPFISSTSKTDKNDYVTTAVQSETNQPINKPSQNSSFNLTYKKNPSLFNVASSGVQSSSLSLNSYPIKPQSQFLEQQVSELGSQKKPFFSNSFGTFVTPKPTSYPGSTAYTSFSSLGYGNSGVSGSLDKSKPTSQFTSTNQYKPSFTNNFGGQPGILKPSNQPTQTSSAFISSNKPTNYKPFVTPSPLNTAKPNEEILVTDQKNSSIVKDFGTGSSLPQQSSSNKNSSTSFVILEPTHFVNTSGQSIASTTAGLIVSIGSESKFSENSEPTTSKTPSLSEGYDVSTKELDTGKTSDNIQSQFLTKPSVETAPQKKPLYTSNSYSGVTDFSSSTANFAQSTSFVNESKEKLKQTSSSISQNKPQFSGGFKEQKGVFHSKEPYPIGAVFVSSNTPLNTSQQTITSQKESELNNYNLESVTGFSEPTKPPSYNGYQVNSSGVTPKPSDSGSFPSKTYIGTTSSSTAFTQQFPYKPLSGSSLDTSSVSTYSDKQKVEEKEKTGVYNRQKNNSVSLGEQKPTSQTFSSNSYFPTTGSAFISGSSQNKPQNQYPAKPIFQHTTQTQPWYLNTYQSFGAVKPFSYSYPGFSSSNFGHSSSIVTGAFDKTNKNSQFSSTWQYKPSYNWGKQKPSNQPTPYSPTTFKPFTSFDRSKLSSTSSVTSQKQPLLAGGFGSSFSISKPTNQQSIDESAYLTGNAKVSSTSPLTQTPNNFNYVSQTSNKPFSVSPLTGGYSYSPNVSPIVVSTTSKYEIQKPTSQTFSNAATSSLILEEQTSELSTQKPTVELVPSSEGFEKDYGNSKPTTQSFNYFNRPIDFRTPSIENKVITNSSDTSESMTTDATGSTASEVPKTSNLDYGAQENNDSKYLDASDKAILTSQREQSSYKPTYSTSVVSGFSNEQKVSPAVVSATETNHVYPDSTESAIYVPSKTSSQQISGNSALFNIQQDAFHLSKPNIQNSVIGQPSSTTVQLPYAGGFGGPAGILKPNEFSAPINHINIPSQYNPSHYNQALTTPHREPDSASYSGGFGGSSGVLKPVQNEKYTSSGHVVNDNKYFSIAHNSRLQGTLTENPGYSNYNLVPNKSSTEAQSNFEERNLGSKATEEAQIGVVNQASVAAADATGEFINHSHNVQNLEIPLNNGASSGFGLELPKNNKSFNDPISGLKLSGLTPTTQGSTETGISSKAFGKSLAPGSATGQGSSGFIAKSVFSLK